VAESGDWIASQLADLWNMLKDRLLVGLVLTVGLMALA